MRKVLLLVCALALTPVAASAQWEVGFDGGLLVTRAGATATFFNVPNTAVRVGYLLDNGMRVESITFLNLTRAGGTTFHTVRLLPGLVYSLSSEGESMTYVRGEFGLARTGGGVGGSSTQWALGGGVGMTKPLQDGVLTRLEAGVDRWLANTGAGLGAFTQFRATAGLTIVVG